MICSGKPGFVGARYTLERRRFYDSHLKENRSIRWFYSSDKVSDIILLKEIIVLVSLFYSHLHEGRTCLGHEVDSWGMSFKKVNNVYKFAGIETVP
jgi:hypothetical protein